MLWIDGCVLSPWHYVASGSGTSSGSGSGSPASTPSRHGSPGFFRVGRPGGRGAGPSRYSSSLHHPLPFPPRGFTQYRGETLVMCVRYGPRSPHDDDVLLGVVLL